MIRVTEENIFQMPLVNKKVTGMFKDELKGEILTEFIGLRSKMYSVRTAKEDKMKKAKGVKEYVVKNQIKFEDYKKCLEKNSVIIKDQNSFRTKLHKMYTIQQSKIALSPDDDKRHIVRCNECKTGACATCNFETLAHGHYILKRLRENGEDMSNQIGNEIKRQKILTKQQYAAKKRSGSNQNDGTVENQEPQ